MIPKHRAINFLPGEFAMKKKLIISTIVVLALAVFGYVEFLRGDTALYDFRFDKVSQGDLTVYVTATGTISAVISVDVGTQVSGIITNLYADFNSEVKSGQVIARLDTTFLYQSLKDAEASLDKAQAQLDDSKRNLVREKALVERGLDAQINLDAAMTLNESNDAALKSAQAALDRAKINLAYQRSMLQSAELWSTGLSTWGRQSPQASLLPHCSPSPMTCSECRFKRLLTSQMSAE